MIVPTQLGHIAVNKKYVHYKIFMVYFIVESALLAILGFLFVFVFSCFSGLFSDTDSETGYKRNSIILDFSLIVVL